VPFQSIIILLLFFLQKFCTPRVFLKSDDVKGAEEEEEENFLFFGDEVKGLMYFFGVLVCMYVCTLLVL